MKSQTKKTDKQLLKELLRHLPQSALRCNELHHYKKDLHLWFEDCPVEAKMKTLILEIEEAIK